jgi:hypothetical protein
VYRAALSAALALALTAAAACASGPAEPPPVFEVVVRAVADDGAPVAGASVSIGEEEVGETGADGAALVVLHGRESQRERVSVACPEGFDSPPAQTLRLQSFRSLDVAPERAVEMRFACRARERHVVLVVRAAGQTGLPVRVHGEEVARTDARGLAHVPLQLDVGATLRVTIDSTSRPRLRPQSPTATYAVRDRDAVFVFDQVFATEAPPPRARRPVRRPPPPPARPVRIR